MATWSLRIPWINEIQGLATLWHLYRIPLILLTLTIFLIIRTVVYPRLHKNKYAKALTPILQDSIATYESTISAPLENKISGKIVGEQVPRRIVGGVKKIKSPDGVSEKCAQTFQVLVFYSTLSGTTKKAANVFTKELTQHFQNVENLATMLEPEQLDLSEVDYDDYFIMPPKAPINTQYLYLLLLPTYNIDTVLDSFIEHLQETHNDFRIDTAPLSPLLGYSVFGFGDREGWPTEDKGFCSQAKDVDKWMAKLTGRKRAFPLGTGDITKDAHIRLAEWRHGVQEVLSQIAKTGHLGEGVAGSGDAVESDVEDDDEGDEQTLMDSDKAVKQSSNQNKKKDDLNDLEDIGGSVSQGISLKDEETPEDLEIDYTTYSKKAQTSLRTTVIKEMVPKNSPTYSALTKQGYSIVGSHSGVKICRWTKSALRGRGSCYKYSFYGIASHQCMETTPSLSCSNKCVFCWRHGTNPIGTTWRWVVDPPDMIFEGVKAGHYQKIKMMRGVPGVRAERFAEAMRIRHCALSLVGEPIFYPFINEFTAMLHKEHISSFLVCNAQHPDQLATLKPVTQLYVSIDASNKESLRKIDRPLHRDFWERFNRCLDILREKRFQQRTVFRLTLVKGFNIDDEVEGYAALVEKGLPCFVEIKGVTYCGTSSSAGAGLTMQNVPFYEEVCVFVKTLNLALAKRGLGYGIAAEHAHSCCVLIASNRFKLDGKWHTRIDYEKFFQCLESGEIFSPEDYVGPETPEWATWGNGGFDPRDERVYRKGKNKQPLEDKKALQGDSEF